MEMKVQHCDETVPTHGPNDGPAVLTERPVRNSATTLHTRLILSVSLSQPKGQTKRSPRLQQKWTTSCSLSGGHVVLNEMWFNDDPPCPTAEIDFFYASVGVKKLSLPFKRIQLKVQPSTLPAGFCRGACKGGWSQSAFAAKSIAHTLNCMGSLDWAMCYPFACTTQAPCMSPITQKQPHTARFVRAFHFPSRSPCIS